MSTSTSAASGRIMAMSTRDTSMNTAAIAAAVMTMAMSTRILTATMYRGIPTTASAKFAIRMRNIATFAAKAWLTAPAGCRTPIR